jgi:hypothetical protein
VQTRDEHTLGGLDMKFVFLLILNEFVKGVKAFLNPTKKSFLGED